MNAERHVNPWTVHVRRDELQIVDVREDDEWAAGRIEGARHIPLSQLPDRVSELDPSRPVVAVCRSGNRSRQAAKYLIAVGLEAHNMEGGMQRWEREGLPFSTPDGRAGRVA